MLVVPKFRVEYFFDFLWKVENLYMIETIRGNCIEQNLESFCGLSSEVYFVFNSDSLYDLLKVWTFQKLLNNNDKMINPRACAARI